MNPFSEGQANFTYVAPSQDPDGNVKYESGGFRSLGGFLNNIIMPLTLHRECQENGINRYGEKEISSQSGNSTVFYTRNEFTGNVIVRPGLGLGNKNPEFSVTVSVKNKQIYVTEELAATKRRETHRLDFNEEHTKYTPVKVTGPGE